MSQLAAGPGRGVHVCPADPQHSQDPRCGCTSNECFSEVEQSKCRAPHRLLASAGVGMGCLGIRCVVCGSDPSQLEGVPIQLAGFTLAG
jgi:hypothetical protein